MRDSEVRKTGLDLSELWSSNRMPVNGKGGRRTAQELCDRIFTLYSFASAGTLQLS
jgi:hypothetical protein